MSDMPTWYVRDNYQRNDIYTKAQLAANNTGQDQLILRLVRDGEGEGFAAGDPALIEEFEERWVEEKVVSADPVRRFAGLPGGRMPWDVT